MAVLNFRIIRWMIVVIISLSGIGCCYAQQQSIDSLLMELDDVINNSGSYELVKRQHIDRVKRELLDKSLTPEQIYHINSRLYYEYESYICDSARYYINENIEIATTANRVDWLSESIINKAHVLSTSGLYSEGLHLLSEIDKHTLNQKMLINYYMTYENIYLYSAEYAQDDEYMPQYLDRTNSYRDSVLMVAQSDTYQYVITKGSSLIFEQRYDEATKLLEDFRLQLSSDIREYAVITSILSFGHYVKGDEYLRKRYLIESAITDIKGVVKENNSLRVLAEILYEEGDLTRANCYMKKSMEDANFYNARLRNIQASKMLPIIDRSYQTERDEQYKKMQRNLVVISLLSLFLLIAIAYAVAQMFKLAKARAKVVSINAELSKLNLELQESNRQQKLMNDSLSESNCIKEEYIGRFLGLCSMYIDKLEVYRRMLNKQVAMGKMDELRTMLKSNQFVENELKAFYHNFDNSFLNIFPHFVEDFNKLLPESERIHTKEDDRLTTGLRIYALIRLGITDSAQIAEFLRYSITTIYTYRSKLKKRSLYRTDFEERVVKIGAFSDKYNY
ncbi:MAG: DUF6377 domain-containing protein [Rikenellaceae bacterium]